MAYARSITISFNTKANAQKCYTYLRNCSILSEQYHRGRGDHCLHIYVPITHTHHTLRQNLLDHGFKFFAMAVDWAD